MAAMLTMHMMSEKYSVTQRTLRFYEEKGMLHPVRSGTTRFYGIDAQQRMDLILQGTSLGFSLREIALLLQKHGDNENYSKSIVSAIGTAAARTQLAALQARKLSIEKAIRAVQIAISA